jgi:hypothetical protein
LKYPDDENTVFAHGNDISHSRYADVMLMLVEDINNQNDPTTESIALINEVTAKHGGIAALSATDVASMQALKSIKLSL